MQFSPSMYVVLSLSVPQMCATSEQGVYKWWFFCFSGARRRGFSLPVYNKRSGTSGGVKGAWNEEQEEELRRLFMENQENPESDQGKRSFPFSFSSFWNCMCARKWKRDQGNYIKKILSVCEFPVFLFGVNWIEVKAIASIRGIHVRCIVLC